MTLTNSTLTGSITYTSQSKTRYAPPKVDPAHVLPLKAPHLPSVEIELEGLGFALLVVDALIDEREGIAEQVPNED